MISRQNVHRLGGHDWLRDPRCVLCSKRGVPATDTDLYGREAQRSAARHERTRIARADLVSRGILPSETDVRAALKVNP